MLHNVQARTCARTPNLLCFCACFHFSVHTLAISIPSYTQLTPPVTRFLSPPTPSLPPHPARRCRKPCGLCCHRSVDCGLPRGWHHAGQQDPSSVGAKTGVGLQAAAAVRLPHTTVTTPTNCHLNDCVNVVTQGQSLCFVRRSLPSIFLDQSTLMVWDTQEMLKLKPAIFFYFPFFFFICLYSECLPARGELDFVCLCLRKHCTATSGRPEINSTR